MGIYLLSDEEISRGRMEQQGFKIQTYLFDKGKWTLSKAKEWLKEHKSSATVDETEEYYRFRQAEPDEFVRMRTVDKSNPSFAWLPAGVKAVVGPTRKKEARASIMDVNHFPSLRIVMEA